MQRAPSCSSARPEPNSSPISLSLSARSFPCHAPQPSATEDAEAAVHLPRVGTPVAGMQQYVCGRHMSAYARPRQARAACAGPGNTGGQAWPHEDNLENKRVNRRTEERREQTITQSLRSPERPPTRTTSPSRPRRQRRVAHRSDRPVTVPSLLQIPSLLQYTADSAGARSFAVDSESPRLPPRVLTRRTRLHTLSRGPPPACDLTTARPFKARGGANVQVLSLWRRQMCAPPPRSPTTPGSSVHAHAEGRHVLPLASTHACTMGAEGMLGPRGCWRSSCVSKRCLAPSRLGDAHVTVTSPRPVESQPENMRGWLMPSPHHTLVLRRIRAHTYACARGVLSSVASILVLFSKPALTRAAAQLPIPTPTDAQARHPTHR